MRRILPFMIILLSFLTAQCNKVEYETYDARFYVDNKLYEILTVKEGECVVPPSNPEKGGYEFECWTNKGEEFDFSNPLTEDIELFAKWKEEKDYTITFIVDGNVYESLIVKEGETFNKPADPKKDGTEFLYWECDGVEYDFTKSVSKDLEITAKWNNEETYKVYFMVDNKIYQQKNVTEGRKVSMPSTPVKDGATFLYWEYNGKEFDFNTLITSDTTLKAVWKYEEKEIFDITLYDGDREIDIICIEEGDTLKRLKN